MIPKAPAAVLPQARTPLGNLGTPILVAISGKAKKDPLNHLRQLLAIDLTAMSCATNSPAESPGPFAIPRPRCKKHIGPGLQQCDNRRRKLMVVKKTNSAGNSADFRQ